MSVVNLSYLLSVYRQGSKSICLLPCTTIHQQKYDTIQIEDREVAKTESSTGRCLHPLTVKAVAPGLSTNSGAIKNGLGLLTRCSSSSAYCSNQGKTTRHSLSFSSKKKSSLPWLNVKNLRSLLAPEEVFSNHIICWRCTPSVDNEKRHRLVHGSRGRAHLRSAWGSRPRLIATVKSSTTKRLDLMYRRCWNEKKKKKKKRWNEKKGKKKKHYAAVSEKTLKLTSSFPRWFKKSFTTRPCCHVEASQYFKEYTVWTLHLGSCLIREPALHSDHCSIIRTGLKTQWTTAGGASPDLWLTFS